MTTSIKEAEQSEASRQKIIFDFSNEITKKRGQGRVFLFQTRFRNSTPKTWSVGACGFIHQGQFGIQSLQNPSANESSDPFSEDILFHAVEITIELNVFNIAERS
jgi:hypothetical protein